MITGLGSTIDGVTVMGMQLQRMAPHTDPGLTELTVALVKVTDEGPQLIAGMNYNEANWPDAVSQKVAELFDAIEQHIADNSGFFEVRAVAPVDPEMTVSGLVHKGD